MGTAVKSLAPAQVIVNVGHEPDGHCDPQTEKLYFGSPAEYRAMWSRFRRGFAAAGVGNAVWAMDYSRGIHDPYKFDRWAEPLWPGDGVVDWLFFNAFGNKPGNKANFTKIVDAITS